jgi:NitT/TauT family transport system substrate-binding protein
MVTTKNRIGSTAIALLLASIVPASAQEKLKVAVGQGIPFDTAFPIAAVKAGIFKKHGLDVELLTTSGGGETLQAVISGSVDVGIAAGLTGVLGAFGKGAPLRVISAEGTGMNESFVYVPTSSPIKSMTEADGKTVAFSTVGASTYSLVTGIAEHYKVKPKFVATGSIPATYSATMSGQVDIGWGAVPFGLKEMRDGKIRMLAWGDKATSITNQTMRVSIVNTRMFDERKETLRKFMVAYYEAWNWAYESPEAVKIISETFSIPADIIEEVRTKYTTRKLTQLAEVKNLQQTIKDAVEFKYLSAPLTPDQEKTLFQLDAVRPTRK